jgi:ribosome biogenesis GTPase
LQTLAANVDLVVTVMSVEDPLFRDRFVDRVLALAEHHAINAVVALTKCDLDPTRAEHEASRYAAAGYHAYLIRADRPETYDELRGAMRGLRSVLVGQSGVGKSTLLNALLAGDHQQIGSVSGRNRRGRHTTNAAHLIEADDIEIVDTPGIRELDCRHIPSESLDRTFREFAPYLGGCEHRGCRHVDEPGCAVRAAVASGTIDAARYESYLRLTIELSALEEDYT